MFIIRCNEMSSSTPFCTDFISLDLRGKGRVEEKQWRLKSQVLTGVTSVHKGPVQYCSAGGQSKQELGAEGEGGGEAVETEEPSVDRCHFRTQGGRYSTVQQVDKVNRSLGWRGRVEEK